MGQAGGLLAMAIPTREPFLAYLLAHAELHREIPIVFDLKAPGREALTHG